MISAAMARLRLVLGAAVAIAFIATVLAWQFLWVSPFWAIHWVTDGRMPLFLEAQWQSGMRELDSAVEHAQRKAPEVDAAAYRYNQNMEDPDARMRAARAFQAFLVDDMNAIRKAWNTSFAGRRAYLSPDGRKLHANVQMQVAKLDQVFDAINKAKEADDFSAFSVGYVGLRRVLDDLRAAVLACKD
jgi:hypothetical protein